MLGAGAWGTALATMLAGAGHGVTLWARDAARAAAIARTGRNDAYLPGVTLDPRLAVVAGPAAGAVADAAMLILAVPAQHLGALLAGLTGGGAVAAGEVPLVVTAKGIERESGLFMDEVAARALPQAPVALLSGPSFAAEVARGLPAAVTLACRDEALGARLARTIARRTFRCYWTDDVRGVALGGALKNVLAIAAGIVTGRGLGENARAALLTRGLAEMMRLGAALGGRPETLTGLAGLGDLMLTATSATSRNTAFGIALARGERRAAGEGGGGPVTEGVFTAAAALALGRRHGVELPVTEAVDAVLAGRLTIDEAVLRLLDRPVRAEAGSRRG